MVEAARMAIRRKPAGVLQRSREAYAFETGGGFRGRERTEAHWLRYQRGFGGANGVVSGGAPVFPELRLLHRSDRAIVSLRRQSALATGNRREKDADLSRMDESGAAHHHERLPHPCRARWIQQCRLADRDSNRGAASRGTDLLTAGFRI